MSWSTRVTELRQLLSDGPTDRLNHRERCLGDVNGVNKDFKTLEFRRVTNFTTSSIPMGVYVNGLLAAVASDNIEVGQFTLVTAPVEGDRVEATFYNQYFLDPELVSFLSHATQFLGMAGDPDVIPLGLRQAALQYSAHEAYQKLGLKFIDKLSQGYLLEDAPDPERMKAAEIYSKTAQDFLKSATRLRNDYYERQGQQLQPYSNTLSGSIRRVVPNR